MGLQEQAKADIEQITSNSDEWGVEMTLIAPDSSTVTITGLHSKHHLGVNNEGVRVNAKNAHVSFSEKFLTDADYPVRNTAGEVNLKNHQVSVKDSTGMVWDYVIREWYPDETIGFIVCILGDIG
jgi:hypothetical protein